MRLISTIVGLEANRVRIEQITPRLQKLLFRGMTKLTIRMQSFIRMRHLSGRTLSRRSGQLSRAIRQDVKVDAEGTGIDGRVFVGKEAFYGRIHEFGGTFLIPAHFRTQVKAWGVPLVPPKRVLVRAHLATFPRRSFMRPTLRFHRPQFRAMVRQALLRAAEAQA